MFRNKFNLTS